MISFTRQVTPDLAVTADATAVMLVVSAHGTIDIPNVEALRDALEDARTYHRVMFDNSFDNAQETD